MSRWDHRAAVLKGVRLTRLERAARIKTIQRLTAEGKTLIEIGAVLGISGERVRQLALPRDASRRLR